MFKSNNILLTNVVEISKAMDWSRPPLFTGSGYYFTWENKTQKDLEEIKLKTGIECMLNDKGTLLVPEYNNFKSEKEKKLLLDLSQYGVTMMWLDMCKKFSPVDLRTMSRILFHELSSRVDEDELRQIIKDIINKVS